MKEINDWFTTQDYREGIRLYSQLPGASARILKTLERKENDRNLSILIKELRKFRQEPEAPKPKKRTKPKVSVPQVSKPKEANEELQRQDAVNRSANSHFNKIKFAELPPALRLRFRELKDIFYDMCDLHYAWSELPDEAEEEALKLQLQIHELDEQRDMIWKELDHWHNYRTILPVKASEDFSKLTPQKLFLKKANLASNISKMEKRIESWEAAMETEKDKEKKQRLAEQINKTQQKLHQHELNLKKILELL